MTDLEKALEGLDEEQVGKVRMAASKKLQQAEKYLLLKLLWPPSFGGAMGVFFGSLVLDLFFQMKGFSMQAVSILAFFGSISGSIGGFIGYKRYNSMLLPFISDARKELSL
ncbi:MAG: hypothetical protein MK132_04970 [Lentisphaerales bacterium]|nr:hypothetical protein [Lentisphaerales bacterium]